MPAEAEAETGAAAGVEQPEPKPVVDGRSKDEGGNVKAADGGKQADGKAGAGIQTNGKTGAELTAKSVEVPMAELKLEANKPESKPDPEPAGGEDAEVERKQDLEKGDGKTAMKSINKATDAPEVVREVEQVGGKMVRLYNDKNFAPVRRAHNVKADFLSDFHFDQLGSAGGKGGSPLAFTKKGYIVKELNSGDHYSLLAMTEGLCKRAAESQSEISEEKKSRPKSFIVFIYLHFQDSETGRNYVAMPNVFHNDGQNQLADRSIIFWKFVFDLKGCRDDRMMKSENIKIPEVHKRFWMFYNCWYCCDSECTATCFPKRIRYAKGKLEAFLGKLQLTKKQKEEFNERINEDAEFLRGFNVMDYSLLIGAQAYSSPEAARKAQVVSSGRMQYMCRIRDPETGDKIYLFYFFGIVDYFQIWNAKKVIARTVKLCCPCCAPKPLSTKPPGPYAQQFSGNLKRKFLPTAEELTVDEREQAFYEVDMQDESRRSEEKIKEKAPVTEQPTTVV